MYGRSAAGVSDTIATHHPEATTRATAAARSCVMRRRSGVGAAIRYTRARAGTTRKACNILVMKPVPTALMASTSHHVLARSRARTVA